MTRKKAGLSNILRIAASAALCLLLPALVACAPKAEERPPLTAIAVPPSKDEAPAFAIAGSGSCIPLTQKLLDAYALKTGMAVHLPPSIGSSGAIKAVRDGKLAIGLTSRALTPAEAGTDLEQVAYARIGVVLGAHPSVPDGDIDASGLVAIYQGTKAAWSDGSMIVVLARESGDSSNEALARVVPGFGEALGEALGWKRWDVFYTDQEEHEAIATTRGSLGLIDTVAMIDYGPAIKALRYEGVEASPANIESGAYPLWKDLYFVYKEPLPTPALAFVDFVRSPECAVFLRECGALASIGAP